ncbi:C39 family peptidase [Anaerococcus hydrogenalis]|uniref:C39 family peptidase n=1 Tax=Anaerococcus hydrogenalis TaxID=33029 RepID=UPI002900165B|nr:C39 family peptidase [Anaerococcus hydrogenalis]MDU1316693.1 C39 family peptidase [Anaerococcus hydrogenalis]
MKRIILILIFIFTLTSCDKDNSEIKNEDFSKTFTDVGEITNKYINIEQDAKKNMISIMNDNKNYHAKIRSVDEKELKSNINKNLNKNKKLQWTLDNFDKFSHIEKVLVGNDIDTVDFLYNLYNDKTNFNFFYGQSINLGRKTPYYVQWDNRWAYDEIIENETIGISGCGPTSMAMVLSRLLKDKKINPRIISQDAKNYMTHEGISWSFFKNESDKYDIKTKEIKNDEKEIINSLRKGPIIVSVRHGYFTTGGHIMVIDSYENGKLLINDPNSVKNSKLNWYYDDIKDQIANVWAFSK